MSMQRWARRIRGAIGMGLVWAVGLGAVGGVPRWVLGIETDAPIPLLFGVFGFVAGVTFSALLMLTERRRRFDQLSLPRFAGWGAVGGLLLAGLWARVASLGWGDVLASRSAGVHTVIGENDPGALSFRALDRRPNIGWSCGLHHVKIHQIVWAQVAAVCSTGRSAASLEELRRNCVDGRVVTAVGISAVGWCNAELGLYRCLRVRKFCCDLSTGESRQVGMIPSVVSDFITLCDQLFCLADQERCMLQIIVYIGNEMGMINGDNRYIPLARIF